MVARRIGIKAKTILGAFNSLICTPLEHPEIGKVGPTRRVIGIEPKPQLELGHSRFELALIGAQVAQHDMRVGVFRIYLHGFRGGGAGGSAVLVDKP